MGVFLEIESALQYQAFKESLKITITYILFIPVLFRLFRTNLVLSNVYVQKMRDM